MQSTRERETAAGEEGVQEEEEEASGLGEELQVPSSPTVLRFRNAMSGSDVYGQLQEEGEGVDVGGYHRKRGMVVLPRKKARLSIVGRDHVKRPRLHCAMSCTNIAVW